MKSLVKGIVILGLTAAMTLAAGAQERKVQFAALAGFFAGSEEDVGFAPALGIRVDFKLVKSFWLSPEIAVLGGESSGLTNLSCTVNYRFGKGFAGLGPAVLGAYESPLMLKVQAGAKSRHWLLAGSFQAGGDMAFAGVTLGYIF
ncbi:MAG: hypothetical protein NTX99_08970 [Candidatus Aminicenantes bacterium]|nr:hypothetical protein [Candidatus Aminicenantes bacterium]